MSAVFGVATRRLTGTLVSSIPTKEQRKLICGWGKLTTTAQFPVLMNLLDGADGVMTIGSSNGSGTAYASAGYTATGAATLATGAMTLNAWELICGSVDANAPGALAQRVYRNGVKATTSNVTGDSSTGAMASIVLGNKNTGNWGWYTKVAECSIWLPTNDTDEQDIVTQLLTKTADNVTGHTPVAYWSLLNDASGTVALTNVNGVTFDGADHPSLTGSGGGGSFQSAWARGSNLIIGGANR